MTKKNKKTTDSLIDDATASMTKKIGVSKTMPKGEARALGTPAPKRSKKALRLVSAQIDGQAEATVATEAAAPETVTTEQPKNNSSDAAETAGHEIVGNVVSDVTAITPQSSEEKKEKVMTITFKSLNKKQTKAIYSGIRGSVQFPLSAFENRQAPQSLELQGPFAAPAQPKSAMSAEERKAARAAAPKPTLAEKIAKREAQLQRLREKAATEASQPAQASL